MKTFNIVKINGKEYMYRVFGNRWGKYLEVYNGTEFHGTTKAVVPMLDDKLYLYINETVSLLNAS